MNYLTLINSVNLVNYFKSSKLKFVKYLERSFKIINIEFFYINCL